MTDQGFPARIETSISFNINLTLHFQPGSGTLHCYFLLAGCQDADHSCGHICHSLAPSQRTPGLQHTGRLLSLPDIHGPLVPHVRQNLYLH